MWRSLAPPPPTVLGSQYTIRGVVYNTVATENAQGNSGSLNTKSFWAKLDNKTRSDFVKQIEAKQQITFTAKTISINDPGKLINHYSYSKTVAEFKHSMWKYGINAVFTIVRPWDFDGPNAGQLKIDNNGNMIAVDLFERFLRLVVDDVVQSSRLFSGFSDTAVWFQEDLDYSLAYSEMNTDLSLFAWAYNDMPRYDKKSHGGPLLFKLIANKTPTTTTTKTWRAIITIVKTYQINNSSKGEVISNVVDLFCFIIDTITVIYDDKLLEDFAQQIITVFTTTSVTRFNDFFLKLCANLVSMELQTFIDITMVSTCLYLKNNTKTVDYVLKYARTVYNNFIQRGIWDKCINATPE